MTSLLWFHQTPQCSLPCWNNLTPGKSGLQDVSDFLARLGVTNPDYYEGRLVSDSADYPSLYGVGFDPYQYSSNYAHRVAYRSGLRGLGAYWNALTAEVRGIDLIFYYSPPGFGPWTLIEELGPPTQFLLVTPDPGIVHLSILFTASGAKFDFYAVPDRTDRVCNWEFELQEALVVPATDDPAAFEYAISWHPPRSPGYEPGQFGNITSEMTDFLADARQCVPFSTS